MRDLLSTFPRWSLLLAVMALLGACAPAEVDEGTEAELEERIAEQEAIIAEQEQVIAGLEDRLVAAEQGAEGVGASPAPLQRPEAVRSEEALTQQLHTLAPDWGAPGAATTGWQEDALDIPEGFRAEDEPAFTTPGELLVALVDAWDVDTQLGGDAWEVTIRVLPTEPEGAAPTEARTATGAVLLWGFADDSVVGEDRRLNLVHGDSGWYVESGQARFHCARGVTDDVCV